MQRPNRLWVSGTVMSAMLVMLMGCRTVGIGEPIVCTEQFVYGLNVTVLDQSTGAAIAADATMTLHQGTYEEVVTDSWDGTTLSGAGERPGIYAVTVEHPGYQTWTLAGVVVTADECHVIPVSLTAELVPNP
ncbi:MAG: carboxypeptidase-like regulatory domain-containing protein [Gemmatimonadota bacterium]|nr:carboxypeptidase-like regulatory domain-containing protein [Gemmatimonadota bacterium]MDE3006771.1 carboxypeptidase-like regulatory domain-containing protein [Gemmatimonadota bacterium]MDE3012915.1 carboxypeptidase-like regulatory domain-containing protein [Gemmatimonadota bacterium]